MDQPEHVHLEGGAVAPTGPTGATAQPVPAGATIGKAVTDSLPESERNYSGNLGNDTVGGPGAGTPPGNTSQRDATGGGAVSDLGSAAGAPIPPVNMFDRRQGDSGMGASGSSADISVEDYNKTHNEDGSLKEDAQKEHDEIVERNKKTQEAENERLLKVQDQGHVDPKQEDKK